MPATIRTSLVRAAAVSGIVFVGLLAWRIWSAPAAPVEDTAVLTPSAAMFVDVSTVSGIAGVLRTDGDGPAAGFGGGGGLVDADGDGDLDVVLVDGRPGAGPSTVRLLVNDGTGRFTDRTEAAALKVSRGGLGLAAGDYDNDGWADLFITGAGSTTLLKNIGGRFHDVTAAAGVASRPDQWSTCATWFDGDGDGDLDLFVCRYAASGAVAPAYFVNGGDSRFADRAAASGFTAAGVPAQPLAVAVVALDDDRCTDLVVAGADGRTAAWRNRCDGTFEPASASPAAATAPVGVLPIDYDLDGRVDRLSIDGLGATPSPDPRAPRLLWNSGRSGDAAWIDAPQAAPVAVPLPGRGAAYGDIDGDGDLDLLLLGVSGAPRLLRNDLPPARWVRLRLEGSGSNRDAIGAAVVLTTSLGTRRAVVSRTHGYLSQSERELTFGLAQGETATSLVVTWPSGGVQTLTGLAVSQLTTITEIGSQELTTH